MDSELAKYLDQNRWLINNGLWSDNFKNQLFMFGSIVNLEIAAVDVSIDSQNKKISYVLYGSSKLMKLQARHNSLTGAKSYIGLWLYKRFLKKHGSFNFQGMLDRCVKDLCGPGWSAVAELKHIDQYSPDGAEGGLSEQSRLPNQLPDKG
jgi:hypothetical protein